MEAILDNQNQIGRQLYIYQLQKEHFRPHRQMTFGEYGCITELGDKKVILRNYKITSMLCLFFIVMIFRHLCNNKKNRFGTKWCFQLLIFFFNNTYIVVKIFQVFCCRLHTNVIRICLWLSFRNIFFLNAIIYGIHFCQFSTIMCFFNVFIKLLFEIVVNTWSDWKSLCNWEVQMLTRDRKAVQDIESKVNIRYYKEG